MPTRSRLLPRLPLTLLPALWLALAAGGCANAPSEAAEAAPVQRECVQATGSNICRKSGSGVGNVQSVSGDDLRRSGGPLISPQGTRIGD